MLTAYVRALGQLFDPRIVRLVGYSVVLSLLVFLGLWGGIAWLLENSKLSEVAVVDRIFDWFGNIATVVGAFFLFPMAISVMIGFFLDAVARAVEARHYPDLPVPKGVGIIAGIGAAGRFLLKALVVNIVLLVFLLVPVLYPFAWLAAHSYLLGREYFELVALRRLQPALASTLRRQHRVQVTLGGAAAVGMFAIPVVNMIAPIVATMAMVHAVERWRHRLVA